MWKLVFLVPFFARLSRSDIREIASQLRLTENRTDDWDSQIAFTLLGETGSLRLFRKDDGKEENSYEFYGTASDETDAELVAEYFDRCTKVVSSLEGSQIDGRHVIAPPGEKIELHW
jgi:hypothetical protein